MSEILSVLAPVTIADALFVNSTAAETEYPAWTAGATFAAGAFCISPVTHRVYQSQKDSNTGHDPTNIVNQAGPTVWWVDYGPTNKWAMFDNYVSTQTAVPSPLTVVLRPGAIGDMYAAGLDAENISVTVKDTPGGNVIYTYTGPLELSAPGDYDEYCFDPFKPKTDFIANGIDQYNSCEVALTLTRGSGLVKCGVLALGVVKPLGKTMRGAEAEPKTFSYIKTDDFGNLTIKRRKAATNMVASAIVDSSEASTVQQNINDVLDVPCAWFCSKLDKYSGLRVFGLGSGKVKYEEPCTVNITVQGMI